LAWWKLQNAKKEFMWLAIPEDEKRKKAVLRCDLSCSAEAIRKKWRGTKVFRRGNAPRIKGIKA